MPRPKVNIFSALVGIELMFQSVKADYDSEHDCYFFDTKDLEKRVYKNALMYYEFPISYLCF